MGLFTQGWYDRIESLLALALGGRSGAVLVQAVLANRKTGGISSGAGQSSTLSLDPITATLGAPGNFQVSGYATCSTSAAGDPVSATLLRDGAPIGATLDFRSDVDTNLPLNLGAFVDEAVAAGPHTYALQVTNGTAGHTVQFSTGYALAQETL